MAARCNGAIGRWVYWRVTLHRLIILWTDFRRWIAPFLFLLALGYLIAVWPLERAGVIVLVSASLISSLLRPELPLYLLAFSIPFGSLRQVHVGSMGISLTDALVGLMLGIWLIRGVSRRSLRVVWPPTSLPVLAFLGAGLLSFSVTASVRLSAIEWFKWAELLVVYLYVAQLGSQPETEMSVARILPVCLILAGIGEGSLGVYQFARRVGPPEFVLLGRFMRASGTFRQPNPYAGYLGLTLPIALGLVLSDCPVLATSGVEGRGFRLGLWLLALAGSVIMGLALVMSWSRGAWLGLVVAAAVMSLRKGWCWIFIVLLVLAVLLGLGILVGRLDLLPASILERLGQQGGVPLSVAFGPSANLQAIEVTDDNWAILERLAHWQAAWAMWGEHPWLGVGIGNYALVYPRYALPRWSDPLGHAHNYYLNVAAETGAVGLVAYLILVVSWLYWAWGRARPVALREVGQMPWPEARTTNWVGRHYWQGLTLGSLGVLTHLAIHNLFDDLYVAGMYIQVGLILGLCHLAVMRLGRTEIGS